MNLSFSFSEFFLFFPLPVLCNTRVPFRVRWTVLKWVTINSEDIRMKCSQRSLCESHLSDKQQTLHHNSLSDTTAASSICSYVWHDRLCVPVWAETWRYWSGIFRSFENGYWFNITSNQRCSLSAKVWGKGFYIYTYIHLD